LRLNPGYSRHASCFSRGNIPRGLPIPSPHRTREAERRQALGCGGTRYVSGPMTRVRASPRGSAFAIRAAGGRSPLGAPPRRFIGYRSRAEVVGVSSCSHASTSRPLVMAEGGFPEPPRGVVTSQPAGRRIPFRLWLVSGDALDERDARKIVTRDPESNFGRSPVHSLSIRPRMGAR
jgi:hypothetical protein